jgi:hypothetical protein
MSETCRTVKIKSSAADNEHGYTVINESDFVEGEHELFDVTTSDGDKFMSVSDIRAALTEKGVEFDPKAKKPVLAALLLG